MDDLDVIPDLRMLSCVEDVEWPPKVLTYLETALEAAKIDSHASVANANKSGIQWPWQLKATGATVIVACAAVALAAYTSSV
jgi:hypothetical protein